MAVVKVAPFNPMAPIGTVDGKPVYGTQDFIDGLNFLHRRTGGASVDKVEQASQVGATATTAAATANAAAATANAAAAAAQAAADAAGTAAGGVDSYANLSNSYPLDDLTTTGHDAGASASITVSSHHRRYGDGTVVAVTGGSVTGLAYSTAYSLYYDDPARAGGTETYHAVLATASTDAFPSLANPNRHFVGTLITPAALAADTTGKNGVPPTYPDI